MPNAQWAKKKRAEEYGGCTYEGGSRKTQGKQGGGPTCYRQVHSVAVVTNHIEARRRVANVRAWAYCSMRVGSLNEPCTKLGVTLIWLTRFGGGLKPTFNPKKISE